MIRGMNHRELLKSLDADTRRNLTRRSDLAGLRHLALHWGLILLVGGMIAGPADGWLLLPLLFIQGVLIVFLFTLLHETTHLTPFRSLWLNRLVGRVCGFLLLLPPYWFRQFHNAHHRHTQMPDDDPELAAPKPATRGQYLWHLTGLPLWWSHGRTLFRNALGRADDDFLGPSHAPAVRREARWMLVAYLGLCILSVLTGSMLLFWCWLLPVLLGQPVLRAYLLAEHGLCPFDRNMLANSRTMTTGPIVRFLAWNMPYHAEHHAWPAVPFHLLPEFHQLTRPHLQVWGQGYLAFHRQLWRTLS